MNSHYGVQEERQMDRELKDAMSILRSEGYAVVILTPDELEGAPASVVEHVMVKRAWDAISDLKPARQVRKSLPE